MWAGVPSFSSFLTTGFAAVSQARLHGVRGRLGSRFVTLHRGGAHREVSTAATTGFQVIWKEREEGRFVRSLRLPKAVDGDKVNAVYQDGELTLHVPKKEPAVKSRITIK